jgi:predicted amidophosphoribosyltransferase
MSGVPIEPLRIEGPWTEGYVLERQHTLSSDFLGYDSDGIPQFDTKRSALGELVFRLKNRGDRGAVKGIVEMAVQFLQGWNPPFDLIVPMPPSRNRAGYQPVVEIAKTLGAQVDKAVSTEGISKIKETPELKDVFDYKERLRQLDGAFKVDPEVVKGRHILLVDDLYRSGETATVVAQALLAAGAAAVYVIAMTKTRTRT